MEFKVRPFGVEYLTGDADEHVVQWVTDHEDDESVVALLECVNGNFRAWVQSELDVLEPGVWVAVLSSDSWLSSEQRAVAKRLPSPEHCPEWDSRADELWIGVQRGARRVPVWTLGERLRKALSMTDLSQGDMADRMGVSQVTISAWLNGYRNPKKASLEVWARVCGVDHGWLTTGRAVL